MQQIKQTKNLTKLITYMYTLEKNENKKRKGKVKKKDTFILFLFCEFKFTNAQEK